jgi:hypothetical protein
MENGKNKRRIGWLVAGLIGAIILTFVFVALLSTTKPDNSEQAFALTTPASETTPNIIPASVETPFYRVPPTVADASKPNPRQTYPPTVTPVIVPSPIPTLPPLPTITATPIVSRLAIFGVGATARGDLTELRAQDTSDRFTILQEVYAYVNFSEGQPEIDKLEIILIGQNEQLKRDVKAITKVKGFLIIPLGKLAAGSYKLEVRYNNFLHAKQPEFRVIKPPSKVFAIGDSVMLGAQREMYRLIPNIEVDALGSRQATAGIETLRIAKNSGRLGEAVVIHLGTNGAFSPKQFDEMMQILADVRKVIFLNIKVPRGWTAPNNRIIVEGVARHPNAVLIDWAGIGELHPEYFSGDGFHLSFTGATAYTERILAELNSP